MVSDDYRDYVLEQIRRATPAAITHRGMFGGVGIYADAAFFAILADDSAYFKVSEANRAHYEAAGMGPFLPYGDPERPMGYYQVPAEVLEEPAELAGWIDGAVAVARAAAVRKAGGRRKR